MYTRGFPQSSLLSSQNTCFYQHVCHLTVWHSLNGAEVLESVRRCENESERVWETAFISAVQVSFHPVSDLAQVKRNHWAPHTFSRCLHRNISAKTSNSFPIMMKAVRLNVIDTMKKQGISFIITLNLWIKNTNLWFVIFERLFSNVASRKKQGHKSSYWRVFPNCI